MKDTLKLAKKVTTQTMFLNALLSLFKLIAGLLSGSAVLIADSFHSLTDIVSTIFVHYGINLSHKPADEEHPYGHQKAELIVTKLVAFLLVLTAIGIGFSAIQNILNNHEVSHTYISLVVVVISIVANEFMYYYSVKVGTEIGSKSLIADGWHHRSDSLSSVAALIGVGGTMLGYRLIDPIAALLVSGIILYQGVKIYAESVRELMDTAPSKQTMDLIRSILKEESELIRIDALRAVFHLNHIDIDAEVVVRNNMTVEEGCQMRTSLKNKLREEIENIEEIRMLLIPENKKCEE